MSAQNPPRRGVLSAVLGTLGFSALAGVLVAVLLTPAIAVTGVAVKSSVNVFDNLPTYISIGQLPGQNQIFANQNGQPVQIAKIFDENRQEVAWTAVSQFAKDAAVDGEDRRFYHHGGVDLTGIARAALTGLGGGSRQGASTIAQQLVKNLYIQKALQLPLDQQKAAIAAAQAQTLDRKLKEAKLAIALEKKYTKDQILLAYLNIAPFGGTTYGIEAAAERYYKTDAAHLTAAQAASLIAIVQQPTTRAPIGTDGYKNNKSRRDVILQAMYNAKHITAAQLATALATPVDATTVTLTNPSSGCIAANTYAKFFCSYVQNLVPELTALGSTAAERKANWQVGGYKIYTTLDLTLQTQAQQITSKYIPTSMPNINIGSVSDSVEVGTGRILVMTENKNFNESVTSPDSTSLNYSVDRKYNGSTYGFLGGSTYKPFTLINWLESGHGLNEIVNGSPSAVPQTKFIDTCNPSGHSLPGPIWSPKNDQSNEGGPTTVISATGRSINGAFQHMGLLLDQCKTQQIAEAFGVHQGNGQAPARNPAAIIGTNPVAPLTMAAAYAGIANAGVFCKPIAVDSVVSPSGKKLPGQAKTCTQAISADVAAAAGVAMQAPFNSGTATAAKPKGVAVLGKTGTTDNSVQTWTVGSTTKVATAVWVGNWKGEIPTRKTRAPVPCAGTGSYIATVRNCLFRETVGMINAAHPGDPFPTATSQYLNGSARALDDYTGQTVAAASAQLTALGYSVTLGSPIVSGQPQGTVASTDPAAGTRVSKGYQITIYPSDGSQAVTVPSDLVGKSYGAASGELTGAGLQPSPVCKVVATPADPGFKKVISTTPTGGTQVAPGTAVQVTVGDVTC